MEHAREGSRSEKADDIDRDVIAEVDSIAGKVLAIDAPDPSTVHDFLVADDREVLADASGSAAAGRR